MTEPPEVVDAVRRALAEDIGQGDITSSLTVPEDRLGRGRFLAREPQVVAGLYLLPVIYELRGGVDHLQVFRSEGDAVGDGDLLAEVRGRARTLLACERVALNFLQHLSGVATLARRFSEQVAGTGCRVLDTRKTTPGLRLLEKRAVLCGGADNHRMGLYDAILIKNNHIAAAGGVRAALGRALASGMPVEIEVRAKDELLEALEAGATHLLLDNFTPSEAAAMVRLVSGRARVEISGGITLENARAYAETGADFVSSGALTHSARATDISFRLELA